MSFLSQKCEKLLLVAFTIAFSMWLSLILAACGGKKGAESSSPQSQVAKGSDHHPNVAAAEEVTGDRPANEFLTEAGPNTDSPAAEPSIAPIGTPSVPSSVVNEINLGNTSLPTEPTASVARNENPDSSALQRERHVMEPFLRAFDRTDVSCQLGAHRVNCSRTPFSSAGIFHWLSVEHNRLVARRCTGFLVGPDLMMTAAHCIPASLRHGRGSNEIQNTVGCSTRFSIVFPALNRGGENEVHRCREIITTSSLPGQGTLDYFKAPDYALIRLQRASARPVLGVDPLRNGRDGDTIRALVADFNVGTNAREDEPPRDVASGTPVVEAKLKVSNCKLVRGSLFSVGKRNEFNPIDVMGNCQIKAGMSGAPVLNARGKVIGIVKQTIAVSDVDAPTAQWLRRVLHPRQRVAHLARYSSMGCFPRSLLKDFNLVSLAENEMVMPAACVLGIRDEATAQSAVSENVTSGVQVPASQPSHFAWHRLSQYQDQMHNIEVSIARESAQWVERHGQSVQFRIQPIRWMEAEEASVDPVEVREELDSNDPQDENYFVYYAMLMPYQAIDPVVPSCRKTEPLPQRWYRGATGRNASLGLPVWRTYTYVDRYLRPRLTKLKMSRQFSRRQAEALPLCSVVQ